MLLWRACPLLLTLLSIVLNPFLGCDVASAQSATLVTDPPRRSNGLTDVVQWDNYTLFLHNQRMFL